MQKYGSAKYEAIPSLFRSMRDAHGAEKGFVSEITRASLPIKRNATFFSLLPYCAKETK